MPVFRHARCHPGRGARRRRRRGRLLEVLTDAKNALLFDRSLPQRPVRVPFRTTTLPEPVDLILTITWENEAPVRVDLDVAPDAHSR